MKTGTAEASASAVRAAVERPPALPGPPLASTAPLLAAGIQQVRHRTNRVAVGGACLYAAPLVLLWLATVVSLDFWLELPRWGRGLALTLTLGAVGVVIWYWGLRIVWRKPSDEKIALRIEAALPEFRSRYISSVQLASQPSHVTAPALVAALLKETSELAGTADLRRVVPIQHLRPWIQVIAGALVLTAAGAYLGGKYSAPLLLRAVLIERPIPRQTQIIAWTGSRIIAQGDDLRLEVTASGVVPLAGTLHVEDARGHRHQFTLDADPLNAARFIRTLTAIQDPFTYYLQIGDNRTPRAEIQVRPRPVLLATQFTQHWPAYTRRPPQVRAAGELKLLAGSELAVQIKPSVPLSRASLLLLTADRKTTLSSIPLLPQGNEWTGRAKIPIKDLAGVTFQLADPAGVESLSMAVTPVTVVPDTPPTVEITWPQRREELVTKRATLLVAFTAKDDFGLAQVRLHYAANWTVGGPHQTLDLDLGGDQPRQVNRRFEWHLDRLQPALQDGDVIDYWFEARDNNTATGPGVTTLPEHFQARVVSNEEKQADLSARLSDTLNGLNEIRLGQEELNRQLGDLIQALPKTP